MQEQTVGLEQVKQAAAAGVHILNLDSTLVPATMVEALPVLKMLLQGITSGQIQLASSQTEDREPAPSETKQEE